MLLPPEDLALLLDQARPSRNISTPSAQIPSLQTTLERLAPFPEDALFLGTAYDDLPILLSLNAVKAGGILIIGDKGAGKTSLLRVTAHAAALLHPSRRLQFGIITTRPREWTRAAALRHCLGIFPAYQRDAGNFILALEEWMETPHEKNQSILLFLDDLTCIHHEEIQVQHSLRRILGRGYKKRVFVFATLRSDAQNEARAWKSLFRAEIYGKIENTFHAPTRSAPLHDLLNGIEFALREGKEWLPFWIPSL
jgi:hypothetical protein